MLVNLYSFQLDKQMSLENIIFQILYSSNFRSIIRNMIEFLMVHYIGLLVFYKELTHLIQKLKSLNETQGTKLDSN